MLQQLRPYFTAALLFQTANVFAFGQAQHTSSASYWISLLIAVVTLMVVTLAHHAFLIHASGHAPQLHLALAARYHALLHDRSLPQDVRDMLQPIGLVAFGVLISSLLSFATGSILPATAGLFFSAGNFLNASSKARQIQSDPGHKGLIKPATNPAFFYGLGYICLGLMAGGFATLASSISTALGISTTSLFAYGLATGRFKSSAAPFIGVAFGTFINMISGLITFNVLGVLCNCFAMLGELNLAYAYRRAEQPAQNNLNSAASAAKPSSPFWGALSSLFTKPADLLVKSFSKPE